MASQRKTGEDESGGSLELLLDTMCNTFGGVIFLAISLVVVMAMIPKVSSPEKQNVQNAESLARELQVLELESLRLSSEVDVKEQIMSRVGADPSRREAMAKLAELQEQIIKQSPMLEIATLKREQSEIAKEAQKVVTEKSSEELEEEIKTEEVLKQELGSVGDEVAALKEKLAQPQQNIVLRKKQAAAPGERPYFIIAKAGTLWRIGPDGTANDPYTPNSDVHFNKIDNLYNCYPIEGKGEAIIRGDKVSPAALAKITSIPNGRFPSFQLYQDCAKEFFELAEVLKARNLNYNVNFQKPTDIAGFNIVPHVDHEY